MADRNLREVHGFISYSRKDRRWLDRLKVHLAPLQHDYEFEYWDDTRLTVGSNWREEIKSAIDRCNCAILIISADFLASDFIRTNELPPLLKSAKEDGALIIPIIASPCLFQRNAHLAQFQAANDPIEPLVALTESEQESIFLKVAETLLDKAATARHDKLVAQNGSVPPAVENFLDSRTWTRLIKIGDWIFDEDHGRVIGSGVHNYLISREQYGEGPFKIRTKLEFSNFPAPSTEGPKMNAGILFGWQEEGTQQRYYLVLITGSEILLERIGFNGGSVFRDFQHITEGTPFKVENSKAYEFDVEISNDHILVILDGKPVVRYLNPSGIVGRVGLRPWRSKLDCLEFVTDSQ